MQSTFIFARFMHGLCKNLVTSAHDFDIISDLKELNGRPQNPAFDICSREIKSLLEAHARVDDKRHGKVMSMLLMMIILLSLIPMLIYLMQLVVLLHLRLIKMVALLLP
jgi:hypothetical protein